MSQILDIETVGAPRSGAPWRSASAYAQALFDTLVSLTSSLHKAHATWSKRRRKRLELLNYIAQDPRAAGDMGTNRSAADYWAQQPFWRP